MTTNQKMETIKPETKQPASAGCAPTAGSPAWLVYQWRDETPEFQGVFSTEEKAIGACRTENHCVCPAIMDAEIPQERGPWPGAWYPHLESRPTNR